MKPLRVLAVLLLAQPALAQDAWVTSVLFIDGECDTLRVGGADMQPECEPQIMQAIHSDGRIELMVTTQGADDRFFVFIGPRHSAEGEWPVVQAVSEIVVGLDAMGERQKTYKASGRCVNEDAHAGPARFMCGLSDHVGRDYDFSFVSDGTAPENVVE